MKALLPLLLICNFSFAQSVGHGTLVIAIRTPTVVYIGADTRLTVPYLVTVNKKKALKTTYDTICKVFQIGKFGYAFAGYLTDGLFPTTSAAAGKNLPMSHTGSLILKNLQKHLIAFHKKYKAASIEQYKLDTAHLKLLEVVIAGFENGLPKTIYLYFHTIFDKNFNVVSIDTAKRERAWPLRMNEFDLQPAGNFRRVQHLDTEALWRPGIREGLIRLISEASKIDPLVGGPIDVLVLDKNNKGTWEPRFKKCD